MPTPKRLSAADIRAAFKAPSLKTQVIHLDKLGIDVTVMEMNAQRLEQYEALLVHIDNGIATPQLDNINAKIAVMSIVDEAGELVFQPDDVALLAASYGGEVKKIANAAAMISGLYSSDTVEKKSDPAPDCAI